jgi:hypothetical protein
MTRSAGTRVKYIRTAIAVVLIAAGVALAAQGPAKVEERVRTAVIAEKQGWQLKDSVVEDQRFWQEWRSRAERLAIEHTEYPSDMDASAWLKGVPDRVPMPGYVPLTGVGDEAIIFRLHTSGKATIHFRKARYTGSVTAPSERIATHIANLLIAQIRE